MTSNAMPRPAGGVELLLIKGEGILFDQHGQRLFHLNAMAAVIWCHLDGNRDLDGITQAVTETMPIDPATARHFVLEMLKTWRRIGLLLDHGTVSYPVRGEESDPPLDIATDADLRVPVGRTRRYYEMLGTVFSLGFSSAALEAVTHPVLAHLETSAVATDCCRIDVIETASEIRLIHENRIAGRCASLENLAPLLHGLLGLRSTRSYPYLFAIHASGLERSGNALILAGRSGSGKTTMAAALMADGWGYMSDDTILLRNVSLEAVAVPYSLTLKRGAWPLLESRFPALERIPTHCRSDEQLVRYLPPVPRNFAKPLPIRWIGFPHRSTSDVSSMRRLSRIEGIYRLLEHCCAIPRFLDSADIRQLTQWSADIRFFEFAIVDLDDAIAQINALTEEDGIAEYGPPVPISNDSLTRSGSYMF
jgi:hypothetical protein